MPRMYQIWKRAEKNLRSNCERPAKIKKDLIDQICIIGIEIELAGKDLEQN